LLLDLALPEMDGVKLVQVLRSYHRLSAIPVVVLTGLSAGVLVEDAKQLNVSSILLKPTVTFDLVREALEKAITMPPRARMQRLEKWRGDSISPL
jgi:CheY-like chemotaxis protein